MMQAFSGLSQFLKGLQALHKQPRLGGVVCIGAPH